MASRPHMPHGPPQGRAGAPRGRRRPSRGITLVELLVVLALLGVIGALVLPNLERFTGSVTRSSERDLILNQIAGLGTEAMLQGRGFVILGTEELDELDAQAVANSDDEAQTAPPVHDVTGLPVHRLDIPDGWRLHLEAPLVVRATGACLGGRLALEHDDAPPVDVELVPPYCRVETTEG